MHYMDCPKNINLMGQPVIPIPNQVGQKKKQYPGKVAGFDIKNGKMVMDIDKYDKEKTCHENVQ